MDQWPVAPVNVRIRYMDGGEDPVELTYEGIDSDGLHQWVAVPTAPLISRYAQVVCDMLPARSSLVLMMEVPGG